MLLKQFILPPGKGTIGRANVKSADQLSAPIKRRFMPPLIGGIFYACSLQSGRARFFYTIHTAVRKDLPPARAGETIYETY